MTLNVVNALVQLRGVLSTAYRLLEGSKVVRG